MLLRLCGVRIANILTVVLTKMENRFLNVLVGFMAEQVKMIFVVMESEKMDDYIRRNEAIDVLATMQGSCTSKAALVQNSKIWKQIKNLPSADVQPRKTAEWVYGEKDGADGWYCSGCGFHIPWYYDYYGLKNIDFIRDFHTCPHCDAKMLKYTGMKGKRDETSGL